MKIHTVDPKRSRAAKKAAVTRAKNRALAAKRELRIHHKLVAGGAIAAVLVLAFLGIRSQLQSFAASTSNGTFTGLAGKCLDNKRIGYANGNIIQLYKCNGTDAQRWTVASDGSIHADGKNFCLDVPGASKSEYTYLQLWTCNGSAAQKFKLAGSTIVNPNSGLCVTVHNGDSANMTRIWTKKCDGSSSQTWKYSGSLPVTGTPVAPKPAPAPATNAGGSHDLAAAAGRGMMNLGAGTYAMKNFNSNAGLTMTNGAGMNGAGIGNTIVQMTAGTSTRKSSVPGSSGNYSIASAQTNPLYLIRISGGAPQVSNLTVQGTSQGHLYNGIRVGGTNGATFTNVKVTAVPGNADVPPGETFGISDASANHSTYHNVEIDGAGVGSSLFAVNSGANVTVTDSYFHDSKYGNGAAFWQGSGTNTITNVRSINNKDFGFNFERQSGSVTITNANTCNNKQGDYRMSSDKGSASFRIVNPTFCGSKLRIRLQSKYNGTTNRQKKSDIHVIVGGVDKTSSLVTFFD